jgi:acyl-CoA thioester hydrolase
MNRIKIELPLHFPFSTMFTIRISDLNYAGHVGNDSFLSLIHDARERFLKAHGYTELSIAGVGLVMADVAIEYKKELHHSDRVKISVAAGGFDKLGFDVFYLLELETENKNIIAGKAKTGMICYDFTQKKRMPVPQEVATRLNNSVR